jgi:hypothetical protein
VILKIVAVEMNTFITFIGGSKNTAEMADTWEPPKGRLTQWTSLTFFNLSRAAPGISC